MNDQVPSDPIITKPMRNRSTRCSVLNNIIEYFYNCGQLSGSSIFENYLCLPFLFTYIRDRKVYFLSMYSQTLSNSMCLIIESKKNFDICFVRHVERICYTEIS